MSRNIRILISYDGTEYSGWQIQPGDRSIQGTLEQALEDLHDHPVPLTGAGRTDAGVHATGQVANFFSSRHSIPPHKFAQALNTRLPRDIRILQSQQVPHSFHARRNATSRQYDYTLTTGPTAPAHLSRYAWHLKSLPPLNFINSMALMVCGTHDFTTFASSADINPDKTRIVHQSVFLGQANRIIYRITANAFLMRMVRSLLGTIIDHARRGGSPETFRDIISGCARNLAGPTAPARGLFLSHVSYEHSHKPGKHTGYAPQYSPGNTVQQSPQGLFTPS